MAAPSGRTFAIYQADDTLNIIDVAHVTDLEIKPTHERTNQPPQSPGERAKKLSKGGGQGRS